MSRTAPVADATRTTYAPAQLSHDSAFYGHYEPSRERVQMLLDYALAHDHDPFWHALARRLATPGCGSPWNAAIAAADEVGVVWEANARVRALVYRALYEGRIAGRKRGTMAFETGGIKLMAVDAAHP